MHIARHTIIWLRAVHALLSIHSNHVRHSQPFVISRIVQLAQFLSFVHIPNTYYTHINLTLPLSKCYCQRFSCNLCLEPPALHLGPESGRWMRAQPTICSISNKFIHNSAFCRNVECRMSNCRLVEHRIGKISFPLITAAHKKATKKSKKCIPSPLDMKARDFSVKRANVGICKWASNIINWFMLEFSDMKESLWIFLIDIDKGAISCWCG